MTPSGELISPVEDDKVLARRQMDFLRTQFLRNMSHRIDSDTIHRLTRCASNFREINDKHSIPEFVGTVFNVGEEYGLMLARILCFYESISGKFRIVDGPLLLRNVIADARADARTQMLQVSRATSPLIDVQIDRDVPISEILGDSSVLKDCIQELLFNAVRHNDDARASVHVSAITHDPCVICFSVINDGIRITDEHVLDIFTPFQHLHRGVVHGSGVGIGLAWCKRMAREMGGDLYVDNHENTTFTLMVPLKHEKPLTFQSEGLTLKLEKANGVGTDSALQDLEKYIFPEKPFSPVAYQPSILVVDDSIVARKQFLKILSCVGIDVHLSDGVLECFERIEEKTYDIICLDIIMPVMSGITCAHKIREGSTSNKNVPFVIVTADSSVETRQLVACIPDSVMLEKPPKRDVLYRTIMSCLQDDTRKEWIRRSWWQETTKVTT